ncbi:RrF2 family transcriptional regulator [Beijerinckia indica]|uniref:Transcriptional regulator, BadM/Rrf2 family n=1 Tax=Beijerinckia indica subsp. indica (strain ATCC 9039 / DSM 1715 / NCIMB 8712) TaxID=395963 RepID=B2IKK0_BEII9|nr:Rrf2 family transcriptional regulator [Beijerinckia indica]ACB96480.1 transcriptional regulator, BadM/Rrf2 family [Beijerinckia indica subsp. indica ATCC 9039]
MILLSRRNLLALAAVTDIALHARPLPVAAKALASRLQLPPRHLETLLQALVRANILKGVRGPRGGYELARERRRITAADILRAILNEQDSENGLIQPCGLVEHVVGPLVEEAGKAFVSELERLTIDDFCRLAETKQLNLGLPVGPDFAI